MSQRAAWQFERLGFTQVYDFVVGKAHWLASGRPTVLSDVVARVGSSVTPAATAMVDDSVDAVRRSMAGSLTDVVVVNVAQIVLGRVRAANLESADGSDLVGEIMSLGPTTIRPDELANAVTDRMAAKSVRSLLVTRTTGELIGQFLLTDE